jgi:hypothetical protein
LAKTRGIMISGQVFRVAGLLAAIALVATGPAESQVLQVPQLQPPSDQFAPDTQQQPAPDASQPQPDLQTQPGADQPMTTPDTQLPQTVEPEATHISNPVAVFAGLDKITGRIINFDVYIDETVQFGALQVTPRVCYTRPPTVEPRTDAFVEVDEITLNRKIQRIFTGWMFADSPGLHAVDNAVYDVWLTDCRMKSNVPPPSARANAAAPAKKQ